MVDALKPGEKEHSRPPTGMCSSCWKVIPSYRPKGLNTCCLCPCFERPRILLTCKLMNGFMNGFIDFV